MSYQSPILLVGEVACKRPGALVNKLESAWLEGIWLGRDSKTVFCGISCIAKLRVVVTKWVKSCRLWWWFLNSLRFGFCRLWSDYVSSAPSVLTLRCSGGCISVVVVGWSHKVDVPSLQPFDCTMRMATSDAGSPSVWMMTFECPNSDKHERIDETTYGSSLPLIKTVDAQAAPGLMSVPTMKSKCGCPWCVKHSKDFRSCLSVEVVTALRLDAEIEPWHRRVMQQVVFLDLVLPWVTRSWQRCYWKDLRFDVFFVSSWCINSLGCIHQDLCIFSLWNCRMMSCKFSGTSTGTANLHRNQHVSRFDPAFHLVVVSNCRPQSLQPPRVTRHHHVSRPWRIDRSPWHKTCPHSWWVRWLDTLEMWSKFCVHREVSSELLAHRSVLICVLLPTPNEDSCLAQWRSTRNLEENTHAYLRNCPPKRVHPANLWTVWMFLCVGSLPRCI